MNEMSEMSSNFRRLVLGSVQFNAASTEGSGAIPRYPRKGEVPTVAHPSSTYLEDEERGESSTQTQWQKENIQRHRDETLETHPVCWM